MNNLLPINVMIQQECQKIPTYYLLINHVQNLNRKNNQKNFHTFGTAAVITSRAKRCHPGSKCCKDKLLLTTALFGYSKRRNNALNIAWIDGQKAFDGVPHSWVENQ
jgi:hypothetical protein